MNIYEFQSYSKLSIQKPRHPCQRNYQFVIPQFLTIQPSHYFLITSIRYTFGHVSIQTTKRNKCIADFANIL